MIKVGKILLFNGKGTFLHTDFTIKYINFLFVCGMRGGGEVKTLFMVQGNILYLPDL